jgi:alkanesulfonate monooxygenase SsuD/methylene tetrahydromethanopterin reductase-like flavin-dependent oxidoreductase (luciferase family)
VKLGIFTKLQQISWPDLRDSWLVAERLGFDSAWLNDHILPRTSPSESQFEAWTMLASLAAVTGRIRIGTLVTSNTFRHPVLLAKMASTVDHTSGGRLTVGIGTGSFELEHTAAGIPLRSKRERAEMLAETCQILEGLWAGTGPLSFAGRHYELVDVPSEPAPVQPGGPPILIGGAGERNLRTAARYADLWHLPDRLDGITPTLFREKHELLKQYCAEIARDPAEIETCVQITVIVDEDEATARRRFKTVAALRHWREDVAPRHAIAGTPDQVVERLEAWGAAGVDHVMMSLVPGGNYEDLELTAEAVLPHLRA